MSNAKSAVYDALYDVLQLQVLTGLQLICQWRHFHCDCDLWAHSKTMALVAHACSAFQARVQRAMLMRQGRSIHRRPHPSRLRGPPCSKAPARPSRNVRGALRALLRQQLTWQPWPRWCGLNRGPGTLLRGNASCLECGYEPRASFDRQSPSRVRQSVPIKTR
jgi:hypothetical protein